MPYATTGAALRAGLIVGLPFLLVVVPFAVLFGALATEAGLSVIEAMGFSVLVIGGASQFTALQLMSEQAPTLIVLISALLVNLRMAMYSAALAPYLGAAPLWQRAFAAYVMVDQVYAASALAYEKDPTMPLQHKMAYYAGIMLTIAPLWYAATLLGALTGRAFLPEQGIDFALPITFLALIGPALRTLAHLGAAGAAAAASLLFAGLPYSLGILPAALIGMLVGAELERRREAQT